MKKDLSIEVDLRTIHYKSFMHSLTLKREVVSGWLQSDCYSHDNSKQTQRRHCNLKNVVRRELACQTTALLWWLTTLTRQGCKCLLISQATFSVQQYWQVAWQSLELLPVHCSDSKCSTTFKFKMFYREEPYLNKWIWVRALNYIIHIQFKSAV